MTHWMQHSQTAPRPVGRVMSTWHGLRKLTGTAWRFEFWTKVAKKKLKENLQNPFRNDVWKRILLQCHHSSKALSSYRHIRRKYREQVWKLEQKLAAMTESQCVQKETSKTAGEDSEWRREETVLWSDDAPQSQTKRTFNDVSFKSCLLSLCLIKNISNNRHVQECVALCERARSIIQLLCGLTKECQSFPQDTRKPFQLPKNGTLCFLYLPLSSPLLLLSVLASPHAISHLISQSSCTPPLRPTPCSAPPDKGQPQLWTTVRRLRQRLDVTREGSQRCAGCCVVPWIKAWPWQTRWRGHGALTLDQGCRFSRKGRRIRPCPPPPAYVQVTGAIVVIAAIHADETIIILPHVLLLEDRCPTFWVHQRGLFFLYIPPRS